MKIHCENTQELVVFLRHNNPKLTDKEIAVILYKLKKDGRIYFGEEGL